MDYIQAFCGVIAAAYFIWVAKSWWITDVDVLLFQRKVWLVLIAALVLIFTYTYGVLAGGGAVIDTFFEAAHLDRSTVVAPKDATQAKRSRLDDVLIPNWISFYLLVVLGEISLVITMPQHKRPHVNGGGGKQVAGGEGANSNPDRQT